MFYVPGGKHQISSGGTIVRSKLPDATDLRFSLFREGTLNRISKTVGVQDIQVNAEVFDRAYMIKGSNEQLVRRILTPSLQSLLVACKGNYPLIEFDHQLLQLSLNYVVTDERKLDQFIEIVQDIVKRLTDLK